MIKTLQNALKQDREGFDIPRSVQDAIPIRRLWPDGIFQFGSKFSKTIRFSDINYAIASKEDKTSMFLGYSELLNALDAGSATKLTINNKRLNRQDFEQKILLPRQDDYLDGYRAEYNAMLMDKVTDSSNSVVQERYVTLSVHRKSIEEARTFFDRVTADVTTRLNHLDSHSEELDAVERLRVLHDFYRTGEETEFHVDLRDLMRKGHSFKDAICPDSLEFKKDHFVMGDKFGRVLFLKEYASYIKDSMINELTALNRTMTLSIDVIPVPTDEAVREMQSRLLGVETNVTNWQRRQNNNNNFSAVVPYDLEQQRKETREMLDDLTTRDQRMMFAVVTLVHLADSKEELDSDTETLQATARKHLCQLATLSWQQADGLVTALPLGLRRIDALRTLTTEALAVLMPFKAQEVRDRGGVYYGQNTISKNLIIANRKELLNGNGFVLGVSGSGKSFTAKVEMVNVALVTNDDIIVIDPESEYRPIVEGLGGEVIDISATSRNHINAMDMEQGYGDGDNPVVLKSEFLLSLCEQLVGSGELSAKEKSIIDRCTAQCYHEYIRGGCKGKAPTLQDFHAELLRQPEPEAKDVALAIELFTEGSLNTFAKPTNVDTDARIICYDIRDLGKQLLPVGMLVVLDSVFNRIIRNRALGRNTWIYIDEIYILFQHEYSANFLFTLWKRVRKYGGAVYWSHAERGGPPPVPHRPNHAGQQRIFGDAEPGQHRPGGAGQPAEHLGKPALLHHQRGRRARSHQVRQRHRPLCKQLSEKYAPLPFNVHHVHGERRGLTDQLLQVGRRCLGTQGLQVSQQPGLGLRRVAVVGAPGDLRPQHVLRDSIPGHTPAVGLPVFVLGILEAVDGDIGLHLQAGDGGLKAFHAVPTKAHSLFQVFGQRGAVPKEHIHNALILIAGQPVLVAGVEIVAVPAVIGQVRVPFPAHQPCFFIEQLAVGRHAPPGHLHTPLPGAVYPFREPISVGGKVLNGAVWDAARKEGQQAPFQGQGLQLVGVVDGWI